MRRDGERDEIRLSSAVMSPSKFRLSPRAERGGALLRILFLLVVLAIAAAAAGWYDYRRFTQTPLPIARADATIDVARGASYRDIVAQLRRRRTGRIGLARRPALARPRPRARRRRGACTPANTPCRKA